MLNKNLKLKKKKRKVIKSKVLAIIYIELGHVIQPGLRSVLRILSYKYIKIILNLKKYKG